MNDKDLKDLLSFDPLGTAEEMTGIELGSDSKEGEMGASVLLGMDLMHSKKAMLRRVLSERGDVHWNMSSDEYIKTIQGMGFDIVLQIPFKGREHDNGSRADEDYYVFWHDDGLLLTMDTFTWHNRDRSVNGASVYYNWAPSPDCKEWVQSSGRYVLYDEDDPSKRIWSGDHDAREAIGFAIQRLRDNGKFVLPWYEAPYIWFTHYGDKETIEAKLGKDHEWQAGISMRDQMSRERFGMLPQHIQDAISKGLKFLEDEDG
jgi:hypothetical protein